MSTSLATVRAIKGVSQLRLEKESGVSERTIRRIETDPDYDPGFSIMLRLAEALGVSLDELVVPDETSSTTPGEEPATNGKHPSAVSAS